MSRKIHIDITPMVRVIHREWDGEESKSFGRFVRKKKNVERMTNKLREVLDEEAIKTLKFNFTEYPNKATVIIEGNKHEAFKLCDELVGLGLMAYDTPYL